MSEEPYLILHKVRGLPAFDIATRIAIGDEEGWIIPTSGHRAYPYRHWAIEDLYDGSDYDAPKPEYVCGTVDPPSDLPDHYPKATTKAEDKTFGKTLLSALGLLKPKEPVRRI